MLSLSYAPSVPPIASLRNPDREVSVVDRRSRNRGLTLPSLVAARVSEKIERKKGRGEFGEAADRGSPDPTSGARSRARDAVEVASCASSEITLPPRGIRPRSLIRVYVELI